MANPLSAVSSIFGNLFASKGPESVLGVDIGSSSIKVVQLRRKSGVPVLETYGELALGPYGNLEIGRATNLTAEQIAKALNDVMREANVTATGAAFSIPFSSSLISLLELPQVSPAQLAQMIPLEARKYIPVAMNEVTLDWFVIPVEEARYLSTEKEKEGTARKVSVLLVAIHNDTLAKYRDIIKATKLSSSFFEIEIFSAARAALEQGIAPVMVLDLGAATTKLYVVEYGIVRVSHIINRGGQDVTLALSRTLGVSVSKAEQMKREMGVVPGNDASKGVSETALLSLEYIFSEANRSLLNYERRFNKNISKVVLVGGGAVMKGLLEVSKKHFETEVVLGNPFAKVEAPAFLENVLRQAGPEFSVATGLALRKLSELG